MCKFADKNQTEETSLPSTIENDDVLSPPSYSQLNAALTKIYIRSRECKDRSPEQMDKFRHSVIDEQRKTSARSVACGQQFPRDCLACGTESPLRRSVCSNSRCSVIVCISCADTLQSCPSCENSVEFIRLFEEESRECLICVEIPFSRSAFSPCGHIVCTACALTMRMDLTQSLSCPFCRVPSDDIVNIVENVVNPPSV